MPENLPLTSLQKLGLLDAHRSPMAQWLCMGECDLPPIRTHPPPRPHTRKRSGNGMAAKDTIKKGWQKKGRKKVVQSRGLPCQQPSQTVNNDTNPSADMMLESSSMSTGTDTSLGSTRGDSDVGGVIMEPWKWQTKPTGTDISQGPTRENSEVGGVVMPPWKWQQTKATYTWLDPSLGPAREESDVGGVMMKTSRWKWKTKPTYHHRTFHLNADGKVQRTDWSSP